MVRGSSSAPPHDQDRQAEDEGEVRATLPPPLPGLQPHDEDQEVVRRLLRRPAGTGEDPHIQQAQGKDKMPLKFTGFFGIFWLVLRVLLLLLSAFVYKILC